MSPPQIHFLTFLQNIEPYVTLSVQSLSHCALSHYPVGTHSLLSNRLISLLISCLSSPLECELHEGMSFATLYPQYLVKFLVAPLQIGVECMVE